MSSSAAVRPKAAPSKPLATKRYRKLKVIAIEVFTVRLGSSPSSCEAGSVSEQAAAQTEGGGVVARK